MSRAASALLLVDGYNIIGAWPSLKQFRDRRLEEARRALIEALVGYSTYQNFDTRIIFDAQYQDSPCNREAITSTLSVCYTEFRQTADSYIERECALFRQNLRKFDQRLIVATSDRAQQLTVTGYGAEWMSAQRLEAEVELAAQSVSRKQKNRSTRSTKRFLLNSLDPQAQAQLAKLRLGER